MLPLGLFSSHSVQASRGGGFALQWCLAAEYAPLGKPGCSADRGGCVNILTPDRYMSKYACGMAPNAAQIEVEKWDGGAYEIY